MELCLKTEGRLLEVGCGEGFLLEQMALRQPHRELWGIDVDAGRIAQASRRLAAYGQAHCARGSGAQLPYADSSFEAVVCVNVFFNLASPADVAAVLREIERVCKPGGRIIFDFRNAANPLLRLKYAWAVFYDPTVKTLPLKPYTAQQMRGIAQAAGLEIAAMRGIGAAGLRWAPVILVEARKVC
jgi:2-polyprenyl-6-hydroxyphenyl methylase/3-demethylubiquinone-9 3-methyltransferase